MNRCIASLTSIGAVVCILGFPPLARADSFSVTQSPSAGISVLFPPQAALQTLFQTRFSVVAGVLVLSQRVPMLSGIPLALLVVMFGSIGAWALTPHSTTGTNLLAGQRNC